MAIYYVDNLFPSLREGLGWAGSLNLNPAEPHPDPLLIKEREESIDRY